MSDEQPKTEQPSEDTVIKSWIVEYGEETFTKAGIPYFKIEFEAYPAALNSLLQSLLAIGHKEDDLDSALLLKKIKSAMTPAEHDTQKLNDWHDIIERIWYHYLYKEFANSDYVKPPKEYPKRARTKLISSVKADEAEYVPPTSKLDIEKFQGFGESTAVEDEEFAKLLEDMKNE